MTSAWQYPVHSHPWFRMPSLKRKAFEREDSGSSSDYSDLERHAHPSKRLRCGILESGLAQLSLDPATQSPIVTEPSASYPPTCDAPSHNPHVVPQSVSSPFASGGITWDGSTYEPTQTDPQHSQPVVLPGSVEEPTSPEITIAQEEPPDVTMKSRSWYEPEKDRIIVVDLDDSDVEDMDDSLPQVTVNSVLLKQIKGEDERLLSSRKPNDSNMALVLFKPLPLPRTDGPGDSLPDSTTDPLRNTSLDVDVVNPIETESSAVDVDDAMDIE